MIIGIITLIFAIVLTIYLSKKNINIGIIMLLNSIFILIGTKMSMSLFVNSALNSILSRQTFIIITILFFIAAIENIMERTNMISDMVYSLKQIVGRQKLVGVLFPMILGLLPSAGGARFSSSMVEKSFENIATNDQKAFINYYFRHVWLDGFILYPALIIASEIIGMKVINLFIYLIPFIIVYFLLGYFIGLRKIKDEKIKREISLKESWKIFLKSMWPIFYLIISYIIFSYITSFALIISVVSTLVLLYAIKNVEICDIKDNIKVAFNFKYIILIVGVIIFIGILDSSGLVFEFTNFISKNNFPKEIVFILLPFIGGFSSGIAISAISISFPILLNLGFDSNFVIAAAYVSGFIGGMITPLHLCAVVSSEYFNASLTYVLKNVIKLIAIESILVILSILFL